MRMTAYLLSAAATIALAAPAFAQDVPTTQPEAQTVPSNTSGTAAASSSAIISWPWLPSRRIATVPSSASLLPTTNSSGTLASECSRTL